MNALTKIEGHALATVTDQDLFKVLQSSLYPGAQIESIKLVVSYCRAANLDPMQKPVHIVPMWDSKAKQMRDVIMPGVGLYRTQASRTGQFAGQSEPDFGPMITQKLGGVDISFPEFARVTVKKRSPAGHVDEFTAIEYWIENYAVRGGADKSIAPNAMWAKRPRGQIAKCAAAQALRLAFPEMGSQPTAEEMEGKAMHADDHPAPTFDYLDPSLLLDAVAELRTDAEALAYWKANNGKLVKQPADHDALKAAVAARRKEITAAKPAEKESVSLAFDDVMQMVCTAKDENTLHTAGAHIDGMPQAEQELLNAKYDEVLAQIRGA